jgi:hypothetical protein
MTLSPVVADAKITALWELRTRFGPRGSPPKLLEELPADVWAGLFSMVGAPSGAYFEDRSARLSSSEARKNICAPFDNPSRSWNMDRARSLDLDRG